MANFVKDWTNKEIDLITKSFTRYSVGVKVFKYTIPVLIVLMIILLVLFSQFSQGGGTITIEPVKKEERQKIAQVMENPRFHGMDSRNQPFNIFAKEAHQENTEQVALKKIDADLTTESDTWVSLVAESGNFYIKEQLLELFGEVSLFITKPDFSGYEIETIGGVIDMKTKIASGKNPLLVKSDIGKFTASGFEALMEKEEISFNGPIKLVINR